MRCAAVCTVLAAFLALSGCGGDGGGAAVAGNSGGAAPGPPGGPPGSPGAPDAYTPPAESAPPSDMPPGDDAGSVASGTPDQPPGDYVPPNAEGMPPGDAYTGDGGSGDPNAPGPPRPKTFEDLLADALLAGNEKEWLRMVQMNFIANPSSWSQELPQRMAWIPGLRRSSLGTRFGIAVLYANASSLPKDFEGSPQPIGSAELTSAMASFQSSSESGANSGEGSSRRRIGQPRDNPMPRGEGGQGGDGAPQAGANAGEQLAYYTGDFGQKFLTALEERIASGDYGVIYKAAAEMLSPGGRRPADPNNPDYQPGAPGEGAPTPDGGAGRPAGAGAAAGEDRLGLGVVWLGKSNSRDEIEQSAHQAGVDLLVTFELTLRPAKNNSFVNNVTRLKIGSTGKKEEPPFHSAGLENRVVMQDREKEKKEDAVEKEVKKAIEALDQKCKVTTLPAGISADAVKRHMAALIAEKPADPLPVLLEMRYYVSKGLITEEEMNRAAVVLVGEAEYARLIATAPGINRMISSALSLPSIANILSGMSGAGGAPPAAMSRPDGGDQPGPPGERPPMKRGRGKGQGRPPM